MRIGLKRAMTGFMRTLRVDKIRTVLFRTWIIASILLISQGCGQQDDTASSGSESIKNFTYLALGDSYTIGESVPEEERWPVQLYDSLRSQEIHITNPTILARTGWTTTDLKSSLSSVRFGAPYDIVSLLIGVNNQFRAYDIEIYKTEFRELVNSSIGLAGGIPENVFVLSIPDYSVTPVAILHGLDHETISSEIDQYNEIARVICNEYGVKFFDITEFTREVGDNQSYISSRQRLK